MNLLPGLLENERVVWRIGSLYIEDFASVDRPRVRPLVQTIHCSTTLPDDSIVERDRDARFGSLQVLRRSRRGVRRHKARCRDQARERFYGRALRRLHDATPNLRALALNGGYIFNPTNKVRDCGDHVERSPSLDVERRRRGAQNGARVDAAVSRPRRASTKMANRSVRVYDNFRRRCGGEAASWRRASGGRLQMLNDTTVAALLSDHANTTATRDETGTISARYVLQAGGVDGQISITLTDAALFGHAPVGRSRFYLPYVRRGVPPRLQKTDDAAAFTLSPTTEVPTTEVPMSSAPTSGAPIVARNASISKTRSASRSQITIYF